MRVAAVAGVALLTIGCGSPPVCVPVSTFALRTMDVVAPVVERRGDLLVRLPVPDDAPPYWPGAVVAARDARAGTVLVWLTGGVRHTGELIGPIVALDGATARVSPGAFVPAEGSGLAAARDRAADEPAVSAARACVTDGA